MFYGIDGDAADVTTHLMHCLSVV